MRKKIYMNLKIIRKNRKVIIGIFLIFMQPLSVYAQGLSSNDASGVLNFFFNLVATIVPLLVAVAVLLFLWGVFRYVSSGGDEEKRAEGYQLIINGVIAIFVMVSIWGFVSLLANTFQLDIVTGTPIDIPVVPLP